MLVVIVAVHVVISSSSNTSINSIFVEVQYYSRGKGAVVVEVFTDVVKVEAVMYRRPLAVVKVLIVVVVV